MTYLLDTKRAIAYLRQNNQKLVHRFLREDPADVLLCSVVLGELFYGAHHGADSKLTANLALIAETR